MRGHFGGATLHDLLERYLTRIGAHHATCRAQLLRDRNAATVQWRQGLADRAPSSRTDTVMAFHATRAADCKQHDNRTIGDSLSCRGARIRASSVANPEPGGRKSDNIAVAL
jgi:hypothetical protein